MSTIFGKQTAIVFGKRFDNEGSLLDFLVKHYGKAFIRHPDASLDKLIYFQTNWNYFKKECILGERRDFDTHGNQSAFWFDASWKDSFGDEPYNVFMTDSSGMYD